jgi:hypothetical protein
MKKRIEERWGINELRYPEQIQFIVSVPDEW